MTLTGNTKETICIIIVAWTLISVFILSPIFWLKDVPTGEFDCGGWFNDDLHECTKPVFDNHGWALNWKLILVLSFILLEGIFIYNISMKEKPRKKSWFSFALEEKGMSFLWLIAIYATIPLVYWFVIKFWKGILYTLGIAGIIGIYYFVNVFLAKLFGKEKSKK